MELPVLFFFSTLCWGAGTWPVAATEFSSGDYVQISSDEDLVTELHSHGIGFTGGMKPTLGKIGKVKYIDSDDDLKVIICDTTWFYSAKAVTKLASAGDIGPEISSNCTQSNTIVSISEERSGNIATFTCTVENPPVHSHVFWEKDGRRMFRDSVKEIEDPRITLPVHFTLGKYVHLYKSVQIKITNMKPEDAGWYTCELRNSDDKLAAVGAVQLSYLPHEEPATSCVDCAALSSIDEELVDIKHLIANSTSKLRSKLNDISERLEMVEHRFLTPIGDEQATS